jgi:hypothetical protein
LEDSSNIQIVKSGKEEEIWKDKLDEPYIWTNAERMAKVSYETWD